MENFSVESEMGKQETPKERRKGGLITLPCILANESFEKVASYGILPNMLFYLMKAYGMNTMKATHVIFYWSAATSFTPIVGAVLADSYLGRFLTVAIGSGISLLGLILLWLTAMIPKVRPPPCNIYSPVPPCVTAKSSQFGLLLFAFSLMSIGAGGIRSSSIAFGADQLSPDNDKVLETFFSWYYVAGSVSVLLALTGIVYVQDHLGWKMGFGVPVILMFLAAFFFLLASPFYIKRPIEGSIFTGLLQAIVVAFKNRKLTQPHPSDSARYHTQKGSKYTVPTDRLRFLNKACIIRSPEDVTSDGVAANPWNLCTVDQVENLKIFIRIIPLWSSGIFIQIIINQIYPSLQALTMDRRIIGSFKLSPGSLISILVISLTLWMFVYDRILLPVASKVKGKQVKIGPRIRMGIGLCISTIGLIVAAKVEHARREKAIKQGLQNYPTTIVDMSVRWLFPQMILYGIADAFSTVGQIEFYYSELPKNMSSISSSLYQLALGVSSIISSNLITIVDKCTKKDGKEGWVSDNINKARIDTYYWLLCILSAINILYFLLCCWLYGPSTNNYAIKDVDGLPDQVQHSKNPSTDFN